MELLSLSSRGLKSDDSAFHVDAWKSVDVNLVSHAHGDHAHHGSSEYWATLGSAQIMKKRLGTDINVKIVDYGKKYKLGSNWVSFHPAGHILGSAQIRIEKQNSPSNVLVFTGDFKRDPDPTCLPFEIVPCQTFITESTFGLPIYDWQPTEDIIKQVADWWDLNQSSGKTSLLFCYSLGKAQRLLAELMKFKSDTVLVHGATHNLTEIYRNLGVKMIPTELITPEHTDFKGRLVVAPPSAHRSVWMKKFKDVSTGFASGWMAVRGIRKGRSYERGFVLSDHADWKSLVQTVKDVGASKVYVTHGSKETFSRFLTEELHIDAVPLKTEYSDEDVS